MGKGVLWSAPVYPASEEVGRVDPVGSAVVAARPDQRVGIVTLALHQRGVDWADLSAICDIEIANWIPRVLNRGRRDRQRRDAKSCAIVRWVTPSPFVDAHAQVFVRPVMPYPCAVMVTAVMVVSISLFDGRVPRNLEWTDQARGPATPRSPSRNG